MEITIKAYGVEFDVEFTAEPYIPAKISGPPENCYPAEGGEIDIESISINGQDLMGVLDACVIENIAEQLEQYIAEEETP